MIFKVLLATTVRLQNLFAILCYPEDRTQPLDEGVRGDFLGSWCFIAIGTFSSRFSMLTASFCPIVISYVVPFALGRYRFFSALQGSRKLSPRRWIIRGGTARLTLDH
jgi:hypothetical protein